MASTPHDPFYSSPFGPFYRRHAAYMVQPDYRLYEMNKRLQARTENAYFTPVRRAIASGDGDKVPKEMLSK
ncbi:UNVERIFIED_CONTAM: LIM domain-binding protein 2 [Gekko kuhli]